MNDPILNELDAYYERQSNLQYAQDLEENIIKTPKQAVQNIIAQLIEGKDQSYDMLVRSLQVLAKEYDLSDYKSIDEDQVQIWFNHEVQRTVSKIKQDQKDTTERVIQRVISLHRQIYGVDAIEASNIDGDFTTALWMLGNPISSNRNINIVRK